MSSSFFLATRQVRRAPGRVLAVFVAALLAAMAVMATGTFVDTMMQATRLSIAAPLSKADIVVETHTDEVGSAEIATVPGVESAESMMQSMAQFTIDGDEQMFPLASAYSDPQLQWFSLSEGHLPESATEFALSAETASQLHLQLGDSLQMRSWDDTVTELELVGLLQLPDGTEPQPQVFVHPASYETNEFAFAVKTAPGAATDDVVAAINAEFADATASDASNYVNELVDQVTGSTNVLATIFATFAAIAVIAAAMVIRNTFQVLLAQRLREIGLLRLVGASGKQVQRTVLFEALLTGAAGALVGIAAGIGVGYLVATLVGMSGAGLSVPATWAIAAFTATTVMTLVAAWAPAVSVRKLPPIAALSASATTERGSVRSNRAGWIVGTILTGIGAAGLTAAALLHDLLIALVAGVVAAIGLIILVPLLVRVISPLVARILAPMGTTAKLAGDNLVRTARRSGTVVLSIALGGSLVIAMLTAISSGAQTSIAELDSKYPVDAVVTTVDGSPLSEAQIERVRGLQHATGVTPVSGVRLDAEQNSQSQVDYLVALPDSMADRTVEHLNDDVMLLSPSRFEDTLDLREGESVEVVRPDGSALTLRVYPDPIAEGASVQTDSGASTAVVSSSALNRFDQAAKPVQLWLDMEGNNATRLAEELHELVKTDPSLTFGGTVQTRALYEQVTTFMTAFVLAMMALTVVISAVGLASVIALSVTERSREIALLRALGVQRRGVQGMVVIEAVALALIGAMLSIVIGIPLGIAAVLSAVASDSISVIIAIPWTGIAILVLAALLIGVIAATGPALRAARTAPAQALARVE